MKIHLAQHHGMCFGVRDALRATHFAAEKEPVTVLGQLVHNGVVEEGLRQIGVRSGSLDRPATTNRVVITAHGVSDQVREGLRLRGHQITDTTCPLVRKAHDALSMLVSEGYHPVVIGQAHHVEVRGLLGDHPNASAVLSQEELEALPPALRYGVVAQTTQPLETVLSWVAAIRTCYPGREVRFVDTVCRPTKQRQEALENLCRTCDVVIVVGGSHSNNTRQLSEKAERLGARTYQIERPDELQSAWLRGARNVGVTAGTSTLDETVRAVLDRLHSLAAH